LTKPKAVPAALLELQMTCGRENGTSVFVGDVPQVLGVLPTQRTDRIATGTAHGKSKRNDGFSEEEGDFFCFFLIFFISLCVLLGDLNMRRNVT